MFLLPFLGFAPFHSRLVKFSLISFHIHFFKTSLSPRNYNKIPLTIKGSHASCCGCSASVDTSCCSSITGNSILAIVPGLKICRYYEHKLQCQ